MRLNHKTISSQKNLQAQNFQLNFNEIGRQKIAHASRKEDGIKIAVIAQFSLDENKVMHILYRLKFLSFSLLSTKFMMEYYFFHISLLAPKKIFFSVSFFILFCLWIWKLLKHFLNFCCWNGYESICSFCALIHIFFIIFTYQQVFSMD